MKREGDRRWVTIQDFALFIILIAGYVATIFVPRCWDRRLIEFASKRWLSLRAERVQHLASIIEATLTPIGSDRSLQVAEEHYRILVEWWWGRFRSVGPRGWRPEIEIEGRQHLDAALAKGHGAVLWLTRFTDPVLLQGLWRHGFAVVWLTNEGHGCPDRSRFGVRWSAWLYRRAENPYIAGRVQIPMDGRLGYMRRLLDRLRGNSIIALIGENKGRQNIDGIVLGRPVSFASGAPSLAERTGAELLTAYSIRLDPLRYRIVIEPPIPVARGLRRKEFIREAIAEYCNRLAQQISNHPSDWLAWQREDSSIPVQSTET